MYVRCYVLAALARQLRKALAGERSLQEGSNARARVACTNEYILDLASNLLPFLVPCLGFYCVLLLYLLLFSLFLFWDSGCVGE